MVYFHHGREYAVVILAKELRYNHLEHAHGLSHHEVVNLQRVLILVHSQRILHHTLEECPSVAIKEARAEER